MMDEEDDSIDFLQKQAFPIPKKIDPTVLGRPAMDGLEYIQQVLHEKSQLQLITTAPLENSNRKKKNANVAEIYQGLNETKLESCPTEYLMVKPVQKYINNNFVRLRETIENNYLPNKDLENSKNIALIKNYKDWVHFCSTNPPLMRYIFGMRHVEIVKFIKLFSQWFQLMDDKLRSKDIQKNFESCCRWLYCLLVFLEIPLFPSTYDLLRKVAVELKRLRLKLIEVDDRKDQQFVDLLFALNSNVCIITNFFGQADLADQS